jgi:hypothetical protein
MLAVAMTSIRIRIIRLSSRFYLKKPISKSFSKNAIFERKNTGSEYNHSSKDKK